MKKWFAVGIASLLSLLGVAPAFAGTRASPTVSLQATSATEILVGGSVTFSFSYTCDISWSTAQVQPFDSTGNRGNPILITYPQQPSPESIHAAISVQPIAGTFTLVFTSPGTFGIDAKVVDTSLRDAAAPNPYCSVNNATSVVPVVVREPATTTTTTTTVAPTTTKKEKEALPATGSNNGTALVAITVLATGATVILARRRLLAD